MPVLDKTLKGIHGAQCKCKVHQVIGPNILSIYWLLFKHLKPRSKKFLSLNFEPQTYKTKVIKHQSLTQSLQAINSFWATNSTIKQKKTSKTYLK